MGLLSITVCDDLPGREAVDAWRSDVDVILGEGCELKEDGISVVMVGDCTHENSVGCAYIYGRGDAGDDAAGDDAPP